MNYNKLIDEFDTLPLAGTSVSAVAKLNRNKTLVIKKYKNKNNAEKEFMMHSTAYSFPDASKFMVAPRVQKGAYFIQNYQQNVLGTLDEFIEQVGRSKISYEKSVKLFDSVLRQIKAIVKFLKKAGINHNDMHMGNLIVFKEGGQIRVKVIDFGLATIGHKKHSQMNIEQMAQFGTYINNGWLIDDEPITRAVVPRYQYNARVKNVLKRKQPRPPLKNITQKYRQ